MKKKVKSFCILLSLSTIAYTSISVYGADSNDLNFMKKINYILNINTVNNSKQKYKPNHPFSEYENLYYYKPENLTRYIRYSAKNKKVPLEDVIWLVNINRDKEFYKDSKQIENVNNQFLLVNKYNYLPSDYEPGNLMPIENGKEATQETTIAYKQMKSDAMKEGISINVVSAYRSIDYQEDLYKNYLKNDRKDVVDTYSAKARYSEHHTGQALDLASTDGKMNNFGNTKAGKWVKENSWKYGFIVRYTDENRYITGYKSEPWHIRYVGNEIATRMHNEDIKSLEEYFAKYIYSTPPNE